MANNRSSKYAMKYSHRWRYKAAEIFLSNGTADEGGAHAGVELASAASANVKSRWHVDRDRQRKSTSLARLKTSATCRILQVVNLAILGLQILKVGRGIQSAAGDTL
jgi:tRNA U34 5-carboxymethylaminomethyl modifying enzyme MnmG/GidA